jgi:hypothetical protein
LAVGRFLDKVLEPRQGVLHTVEIFCDEVDLSVNPDKIKLVVFTRERKLSGFFDPLLFKVTLHRCVSVKYPRADLEGARKYEGDEGSQFFVSL